MILNKVGGQSGHKNVHPRQFERILKFLKNFPFKKSITWIINQKFQTIKMFDKNCFKNIVDDVLEYF